MRKLVFVLFGVLMTQVLIAKNAESVKIKGRFIVIEGDYDNTRIQLRNEYGGIKPIGIGSRGRFSFEAERDQNYIVQFSKDGYIQKEVKINTYVEGEELLKLLEFNVKLFPQVSTFDDVKYDQPVGEILIINGKEFSVEFNYRASLEPRRMKF